MFLGLIFWAFHVVHHVHVVHVVHVFLDPKFPRWPFLCRNLTRKARDGTGWPGMADAEGLRCSKTTCTWTTLRHISTN